MKVSFFIDRPVFSAVISILIVIVGIIGLMMLPIDQYPQITPPVVKISASYPGASAVTVSQAVATPIEQELNGTPGMLLHGIQQFQLRRILCHCYFRYFCRPRLSGGRNPEPYQTGGISSAGGSDSEWYLRRKTGTQSADDAVFDFGRPQIRRNLFK